MEIIPVSSEITIINASVISDKPSAARCRVPNRLSSIGVSDKGSKQLADSILFSRTIKQKEQQSKNPQKI